MKTPEAYAVVIEEVMNTIQLDAFKAGAEWAANEVRIQQFKSDFPIENGDKMYLKIMDNISNLKEIPK